MNNRIQVVATVNSVNQTADKNIKDVQIRYKHTIYDAKKEMFTTGPQERRIDTADTLLKIYTVWWVVNSRRESGVCGVNTDVTSWAPPGPPPSDGADSPPSQEGKTGH